MAVTRPLVTVDVRMEKLGALLGVEEAVARFVIARRRAFGVCILISRIPRELVFVHASLFLVTGGS